MPHQLFYRLNKDDDVLVLCTDASSAVITFFIRSQLSDQRPYKWLQRPAYKNDLPIKLYTSRQRFLHQMKHWILAEVSNLYATSNEINTDVRARMCIICSAPYSYGKYEIQVQDSSCFLSVELFKGARPSIRFAHLTSEPAKMFGWCSL